MPTQKRPLLERIGFVVDIVMIILSILDLTFIAFDSLFNVRFFRDILIGGLFPSFRDWYANDVHEDFLLYESAFLTLFITEIIIRWILAIIRRTYEKWFFYPFIHWYDVIGCIPTSTFRLLRFIRVGVLTYRLHFWGVINLNNYSLYRSGVYYYNILVEEISDRVAVSLISQARDEVKRGIPMSDDIVAQVLQPKRREIVGWAAGRIQEGLHRHYLAQRFEIQSYLQQIIQDSVKNNQELRNLARIPVMGPQISASINQAVQDITFNVIDRLTSDFAASEKKEILEAVVDAVTEVILSKGETKATSSSFMNQIVIDSMEVMIERVKSKRWKQIEEQFKPVQKD